MQFFPSYFSTERRLALDDSSLAWQQIGLAELKQLKLAKQSNHLLLPAPLGQQSLPQGEAQPTSSSKALVEQAESLPPMVLTGPGGRGAVHVCEHTACRLPAENWWTSSKGSSKKQGEGLQRSRSAPG
jgi:hypothetical protein